MTAVGRQLWVVLVVVVLPSTTLLPRASYLGLITSRGALALNQVLGLYQSPRQPLVGIIRSTWQLEHLRFRLYIHTLSVVVGTRESNLEFQLAIHLQGPFAVLAPSVSPLLRRVPSKHHRWFENPDFAKLCAPCALSLQWHALEFRNEKWNTRAMEDARQGGWSGRNQAGRRPW